jgi:tungstate transport system ATP-binding protein
VTVLLEIQQLRICRDGQEVLAVPNLEVETGEVLAVLGPNGSGKSTFFLSIAGLLPLQAGNIRLAGSSLRQLDGTRYRRRLALIMQEPLLFDTSVHENVAIGLKFRRMPQVEIEARVRRWLERLEIAHLATKSARKLSGGEAQRVSLARAFALEPQLLLLDEPFAGLDRVTRRQLLGDLRGLLAETQTTAIFITHDLEEALQLATRMAVVLEGRLVQVGGVQELLSNPATAEVGTFLGTGGVHSGRQEST